ncbi:MULTISPECIES: ABC transporter permease [unclassified Halorhabdus]|uniref:ABC transporter permease n=1 Tax=unclassified Halorhabdus TaxID=2621901 RepID=UPI0023DAA1C2|nr:MULTISPECIES: ABC transporter permease [unclassified Halorhabdus]WEL17272.1 ABC-type multidrug transport system, permease component [Halorhabdus sp. SVX81]WEL21154.1 ABC-type multidrug transport system, permease component [Halorhabdus sp. BNX81]
MSTDTAPDREVARTSNSFLRDVWTNFMRWNINAIRNPFVVVSSLLQPIIFLVLFTQVFGNIAGGALQTGINYETYLLPAIAVQIALIVASSSGIGLVDDIESGVFQKTLVTPMNRAAVFLGKTLSELVRIVVQVVIILVLGVVLGAEVATGIPGALAIVGIAVLFSLWFLAFSNTVALITRDQESTIIAANMVQLPLLFVSSAFLPVSEMKPWIQTVATYNPITYGVDAARAIMLDADVMEVLDVTAFGGIWNTLVPSIAILLVLDVILGAIAVYMINRASSASVQ